MNLGTDSIHLQRRRLDLMEIPEDGDSWKDATARRVCECPPPGLPLCKDYVTGNILRLESQYSACVGCSGISREALQISQQMKRGRRSAAVKSAGLGPWCGRPRNQNSASPIDGLILLQAATTDTRTWLEVVSFARCYQAQRKEPGMYSNRSAIHHGPSARMERIVNGSAW